MRNLRWVIYTLAKFRLDMITLTVSVSVCRTCNRYIISNNHPLNLFGEKTIRKGIVRG